MNDLYLSTAIFGCYAGSYTDYLTGPASNDYSAASTTGQGNDLTSYIPSLWAQEGLAILEENMVMANLVHRDFENAVAKFGDVVNTRKPAEFTVSRKDDGSTLVHENATAQNVQVALNQWFQKSFVIKDGEGSMAFQDLKDIYLQPAMQSIARGIDRAILGRVHAFLATAAKRVGGLGKLDYTTAKNYILDARDILNRNLAWPTARRLVLGSSAETAALKTELFISAEKRGDGGNALENAMLGRILGFDTYMDQNVNDVQSGTDYVQFNLSSGALPAGTTVLLETAATGADLPTAGEWVVVAGNDQPNWVAAQATGVSITLNEGLKTGLAGSNQVTKYTKFTVGTTYAVGYSQAMAATGYTNPPQVGQLVAFGDGTTPGGVRQTYTIIESKPATAGYSILLDRPLETTLASTNAFPGPMGSFNLAFHRDAIALITRPLALPNAGVQSGTASYNGIGMRVLMQYDINHGGTVVNCDILAGVAVLDPLLAVVLLG